MLVILMSLGCLILATGEQNLYLRYASYTVFFYYILMAALNFIFPALLVCEDRIIYRQWHSVFRSSLLKKDIVEVKKRNSISILISFGQGSKLSSKSIGIYATKDISKIIEDLNDIRIKEM